MLKKKTLLTANNLNSAYISKNDINAQSIDSALTVKGGSLTLKNSIITDNASTGYLRIDPQGNQLIVYDGVNNQNFKVFSSSGSEATEITTINGTTSHGLIDVTSAVDHLKIMTNTAKKVEFGGDIGIATGKGIRLGGTMLIQADSATYGVGLTIGGGGRTIVGSGESASQVVNNSATNNDTETLFLSSDADIKLITNLHGGWVSGNSVTIGSDGKITLDDTLGTTIINGAGVGVNRGYVYFQSLAGSSGNVIVRANESSSAQMEITPLGGFTFNGNKIWHAGNDGANSGLDADMVHGLTLSGLDSRYDGRYVNIGGDTYSGTHDLTNATLSWARDSDNAKIHLVDYGANTDWLTVDFGDDPGQDRVRFRFSGSTTIFDVVSNAIDSHVPLYMNNNTINGFSYLNGQYGEAIQSTDEWLRINDSNGHANGIYMGTSHVRTDGDLSVGSSGAYFKASSSGVVIGNINTLSTGGSSSLKHSNSSGYIEIGPMNTSHAHIYTDRPNFYFNKDLLVLGSTVIHTGNFTTHLNGTYVNKSGDNTANLDVYSTSNDDVYSSAALEIRELNLGGAQTGAQTEAPRIAFHWGGRVASQIALNTDGTIMIRNNPGTGYEKLHAGDIHSHGNLGVTNNLYVNAADNLNTKISWWGVTNSYGMGMASAFSYGYLNDYATFFNMNNDIDRGWIWRYDGQAKGDGAMSLTTDGRLYLKSVADVDNVVARSKVSIHNGGDLNLYAGASSTDSGDIVYRDGGGAELGRIWYDPNRSQLSIRSNLTSPSLDHKTIDTFYENGYRTISTSGWYRIASNAGNRAYGRFIVMDVASGRHDLIDFTAGVAYNRVDGANIHMLGRIKYGSGETIGGLRFLTAGTYDTQYLDVYLASGSNVRMIANDNHWSSGWSYHDFSWAGSIPTGYTQTKMEMQGDFLTKPQNLMTGSSPPSQGAYPGDVFVSY